MENCAGLTAHQKLRMEGEDCAAGGAHTSGERGGGSQGAHWQARGRGAGQGALRAFAPPPVRRCVAVALWLQPWPAAAHKCCLQRRRRGAGGMW
jgi:hypothetical protein